MEMIWLKLSDLNPIINIFDTIGYSFRLIIVELYL